METFYRSCKNIYEISSKFPKEEIYGLTAQIRRAAISVESLSELETQLIIANELSYMDNNKEIFQNITDLRKLLLGLRKHLKSK